MIKGLIFDMDGLILDTESISNKLLIDIFSKYDINLNEEIISKTIGLEKKKAMKVFEEYLGDNIPIKDIINLHKKVVNDYLEKNGVPVKLGLIELLNYLDEEKIKKVVATSSYRKVAENVLIRANVYNRFDDIICGDEIKESKPSPDIFLKALEKLNLSADEVIVLEDSRMGILAAHRAKIKSIMIPDILPADEETKKLYFKECKSLLDVIHLLKTFN
ncbi:HAD family phosphatase [Megamonas rupellensis]|jgi:HAD superfamily hydrolase (TIGR01509 family)|uniref:HAD family phosphatase n=1 Tax=Megamonas rupellensis TaxID=491921 RepID=A0A412CEW2_9FIRM|nr:HAD family phosphatase [Megamonas rupellensis]RGQ83820.1 HAD family phosphatase [Megamonas rupellensis]